MNFLYCIINSFWQGYKAKKEYNHLKNLIRAARLFVMNREQYEMIWELFLQDKTYKLERIDVPEGTLVIDDNILMSDLLQNDQLTPTSEN